MHRKGNFISFICKLVTTLINWMLLYNVDWPNDVSTCKQHSKYFHMTQDFSTPKPQLKHSQWNTSCSLLSPQSGDLGSNIFMGAFYDPIKLLNNSMQTTSMPMASYRSNKDAHIFYFTRQQGYRSFKVTCSFLSFGIRSYSSLNCKEWWLHHKGIYKSIGKIHPYDLIQ